MMLAVGIACVATFVALWALLGVMEAREALRRVDDVLDALRDGR